MPPGALVYMVRAEFLADSAASFTIMTAPVAPEGPAGAFGGYTLLDGLRTASKSWFGKAIMTLVFGVIIVSFAIWGIGDIFRGFGQGKLGVVGSTEISSEAYRYAYQTELQRLQQRLRRVVTNDEARQAGLDRQVLGRLVTEAALDQKAKSLGLAMSDQQLAKSVQDDPGFKDPVTGAFDRARFDAVLRDNGLNERTFVREQKATYLRQEIGQALAGALETPKVMTAAVDRYRNQARSVDYVLLTPSTAGEAQQPSDEELKKFYEERKAQFVAPQYRKIVTLAVTPTTAAKPADVSDADAQKVYDASKETRFGTPEKRDIQQIVFPNEAEAQAAAEKIKSGASFDSVAAERKLTARTSTSAPDARAGAGPGHRRGGLHAEDRRGQRAHQEQVRRSARARRQDDARRRAPLRRRRAGDQDRDRARSRQEERAGSARQDRGPARGRQAAGGSRQGGGSGSPYDRRHRRARPRAQRPCRARSRVAGRSRARGLRLRYRRRQRDNLDQGQWLYLVRGAEGRSFASALLRRGEGPRFRGMARTRPPRNCRTRPRRS
ncbi:MAG: peptidylprolyl isomerase [Methylobacteriaceae bacterium]|nr:peptidylprolyl isomerase [Methylobacteriaceae bacterium]